MFHLRPNLNENFVFRDRSHRHEKEKEKKDGHQRCKNELARQANEVRLNGHVQMPLKVELQYEEVIESPTLKH